MDNIIKKPDLQKTASDFHLKEYEFIRQGIINATDEQRRIQRYVVVGTGGVWVWLLVNANIKLPMVSWWLPFIFVCVGGFISYNLYKHIKMLAEYSLHIEKYFHAADTVPGWESFLEQKRGGGKDNNQEF